jgi:acyl-CoA thioester hydrolase
MTDQDVVETSLRVRYAETDAMGVVYHTNYIIWFEVGRGEYLREKGGEYREFEGKGFYLPVIEVDARFLAAARYDDVVVVRTSLQQFRSRSITLYYEVVKKDTGQLLVTGHTRHLCTDPEGRVRRFPQQMIDVFKRGEEASA